MAMSHDQYIRSRREVFQNSVAAVVATLLQQKHMYQGVMVPRADVYYANEDGKQVEKREAAVTTLMENAWSLEQPAAHVGNVCYFKPPDVKLFCTSCDRVEAYNLVLADETFRRIQNGGFRTTAGDTLQLFLFSYQCQSCKGTPEVFLIRRRGLRLTNEGRSPIEHVEVPAFVPKPVQRFLGGAIVAHQSGQSLAGNFLLRTLIEQWARSSSGSTKDQADQVMDDYMATLPDDFKVRFPSMRALYGDLSVDIHTAAGSAELFEKARAQIVEHFDARRMFKIA